MARTVLISIIQSYAYSVFLVNLGASQGLAVVPQAGVLFTFSTIITQTAGTIFVMWMGEKITEHGIGNGIGGISAPAGMSLSAPAPAPAPVTRRACALPRA